MKIFFYGGTFNPPHLGHAKIVEDCLSRCDKLIIMPAKFSPEKINHKIAHAKHRFNMLSLIFDSKKISIDSFELSSTKINYSYLTIKYLKKKYIDSDITMIIGFDQLLNFKNWKNKNQILNDVNIICFNRKNKFFNKAQMGNLGNIEFVDDFNCEVSSSNIREQIENKNIQECTAILDEKIIHYIIKHNLYVS